MPARMRRIITLTLIPILIVALSACTPDQPTSVAAPSPINTPLPTSPSVPTNFPPITLNSQWTPIVREFEGVEMALVPPGCFQMGDEGGWQPDSPIHEQCIDDPFWIDVTEVTNAQYGSSGYFSGGDRPREEVSWREAVAHCESRGARLPTEVEWEYAARGPDSLKYPWGNEFVEAYIVYGGNSGGHTADVGSRPGGVSWVGALDMSGNVW